MSIVTSQTTSQPITDGTNTAVTHLPVLLNPLVNTIFNCPDPNDTSIKKLFTKLKSIGKFALLVPSSFVLFNYIDTNSTVSLAELCNYDQKFISSHIISLDDQNYEIDPYNMDHQHEFTTLNSNKLIINFNKNIMMTADFPFTRKCKVLRIETLQNFNDYLQSDRFTLIHIDYPLIDPSRLARSPEYKYFTQLSEKDQDNSIVPLSQDISQRNKAYFQNLLHLYPEWNQKFNDTINYINNNELPLDSVGETFHNIALQTYEAMKNGNIFMSLDKDLYRLIHDYMEQKVYNYVWRRIRTNFKDEDNTNAFFDLDRLSIDQLETDLYTQNFNKFNLSTITQLEQNINQAINTFSPFSNTNSFQEKSAILTNTLQVLSSPLQSNNNESIPIDADTLLSLFVLIINRTQIRDLHCHLYYLQNFYYKEDENDTNMTKFGMLGYSISTLEAVTYYICNNQTKFTALKDDTENKINKLVNIIQNHQDLEPTVELNEFKGIFKYRNELGESIISQCIKNFQNQLMRQILTEFENDFPLEDLMDDQSLDGSTLLHQAFKNDNHDAVVTLIKIFMENCTSSELVKYFNRPDTANRSIAHYLSSQMDIVSKIGKFINWNLRDATGKTPLFTIFRSYDQTNYSDMVATTLDIAKESTKGFRYSKHTDSDGNTLLHILKSDISILLDSNLSININQKNRKGLTPLIVFIKYNRISNVQELLKDKRLDFVNRFDIKKYLTTYDYVRDTTILNLLVEHHLSNGTNVRHGICHSLRISPSAPLSSTLSCSLRISFMAPDKCITTININIKLLKNLFKILLKRYPMIFVPVEKQLIEINTLLNVKVNHWKLDNISSLNVFQNKLSLLTGLTNILNTLIEYKYVPIDAFKSEENLVQWLRDERKLIIPQPLNYSKGKDHNLEPEEINNVKNFLKFNNQELNKLKRIVISLEKLLIFRNLKNNDTKESINIVRRLCDEFQIHELIRPLKKTLQIRKIDFIDDNNDISLNCTLLNLKFFKNCLDNLVKNIEHILSFQINEWWRYYGEILQLNKTIIKNYPSHTINSTINHTGNQDRVVSDGSSNGVFSNFIEGQRLKTEQRLKKTTNEVSKLIQNLGNEIMKNHERLAEELSNFMSFKNKFIFDGIIKVNVIENINNLNEAYLNMQERLMI